MRLIGLIGLIGLILMAGAACAADYEVQTVVATGQVLSVRQVGAELTARPWGAAEHQAPFAITRQTLTDEQAAALKATSSEAPQAPAADPAAVQAAIDAKIASGELVTKAQADAQTEAAVQAASGAVIVPLKEP